MPEFDYSAAHKAAVEAHTTAINTVKETKAALDAAEREIARTSPSAILAAGGDLMAGSTAHNAALARREYIAAALKAAEANQATRLADQVRAERETHRPAFNRALGRRLAACRAADEARAALEAADREFRAATAAMEATHARGLQRYFDGGLLQGAVRTEQDERAMWQTEAGVVLHEFVQ